MSRLPLAMASLYMWKRRDEYSNFLNWVRTAGTREGTMVAMVAMPWERVREAEDGRWKGGRER